jgi:hypothetical protein
MQGGGDAFHKWPSGADEFGLMESSVRPAGTLEGPWRGARQGRRGNTRRLPRSSGLGWLRPALPTLRTPMRPRTPRLAPLGHLGSMPPPPTPPTPLPHPRPPGPQPQLG